MSMKRFPTTFRSGLSTGWAMGLFVVLVLMVPYACFKLAETLDTVWALLIPLAAFFALSNLLANGMNEKWARLLGRIEDPFSKHTDPKAGLMLAWLPIMTCGVLLAGVIFWVFQS